MRSLDTHRSRCIRSLAITLTGTRVATTDGYVTNNYALIVPLRLRTLLAHENAKSKEKNLDQNKQLNSFEKKKLNHLNSINF